jgi:hypothetical protein
MSLAINTLIRVSGEAQTFWWYQTVHSLQRDASGVVMGAYGMWTTSHEKLHLQSTIRLLVLWCCRQVPPTANTPANVISDGS